MLVSGANWERALSELPAPLPYRELLEGQGQWEVEIGFGKGRELLRRAATLPGSRFLGVEIASKYYRLVRDRARRRNLDNLLLIRGEAVFLMSAVLPPGMAAHVHVYFPDPWPKSRHHKRRLFDTETVDLLVGLIAEEGRLSFATDHQEYGEIVEEILRSHPALETRRLENWPEGARTNYEAKFEREGRPIVRLEAVRLPSAPVDLLHPAGRAAVLAATCPHQDDDSDDG